MLQLLVAEPGGAQWSVRLEDAEYTVGRDRAAAVLLRDARISKRHARVFRTGGGYCIEDLGSTNGVTVDGARLQQPVKLASGMHIEIGSFVLEVQEIAGAGARFQLVGKGPPVQGQIIALSDTMTVGRGVDNALHFDHPSLSRQHAMVHVSNTEVEVEDLHSSNGTYVNGVRVTRHRLQAGDEVRFGAVPCLFEEVEALGAPVAAKAPDRRRPRSAARVAMGAAAVFAVLAVWGATLVHKRTPRHSEQQMQEERAYEQNLAEQIKRGRAQLDNQAWGDAIASYRQALDLDPIDVDARAGLALAETNRDHQAALAQATDALARRQPERALGRIYDIGPQAFYGSAASSLADRARDAITRTKLAQANGACRSGSWQLCQGQAAQLLTYVPTSVEALALIEEAEDAMRTHRLPHVPWNASHNSDLARIFPDSEVREAVLRYGTGDVDLANKRLRTFARRPGASSAAGLITNFIRLRASGDAAASAGNLEGAARAWEQAVRVDSQLLSNGPSALGYALRVRLATQLLQQGATAFDRGQYPDASQKWRKALEFDPQNADATAALTRLENRAASLLSDIASQPTRDSAACARLRDVLAMTRPDGATHKAAKSKMGGCPAK